MTYMDFLGINAVQEAWGEVNFGPGADPINTIGRNLVKVAHGYGIGSGAFFLLDELGLAINGKNKIKLTEKGFEFLSLPFNK